MKKILILKLGHRPSRDKRITTHLCLVARAFGAEGVYISGIRDDTIRESLNKMTETWGGTFWVKFNSEPMHLLKDWKIGGGMVAHLTMYGIPIKKIIQKILSLEQDLLVIVGGEKVPKQYYLESDFNISIGDQPHSEIAALAIFLDRITLGLWEGTLFKNAKIRIIPSDKGKTVEQISPKKESFLR
jgi:tRNA (cytidine56-2'-O)-methyltransferase